MPFINWGQVISVTAENVLIADNVALTFFGGESTKIKLKKSSLPGGREEKKLNCLSTALVKNENQSASPRFTLSSTKIVRNIDISINKCTVLFGSDAMGPVAIVLIRLFFSLIDSLN